LTGLGKDEKIIFIWIFNFNQMWHFMTDFNLLVMFNDRFLKVLMSNFMKIYPVGAMDRW